MQALYSGLQQRRLIVTLAVSGSSTAVQDTVCYVSCRPHSSKVSCSTRLPAVKQGAMQQAENGRTAIIALRTSRHAWT